MTPVRSVLLMLAVAPALSAAELTLLDGKKLTGDIVAVSPTEVTFKVNGVEDKHAVTAINGITLGPAPKPVAAGRPFVAIELIDGTTFRCSAFALKGKSVEMTLLAAEDKPNRVVTVPMTALFSVLRDANNLKVEQDFRTLMRDRGKFDVWITRNRVKDDAGAEAERLDAVRGTFGEGDAAADAVKFTLEATGKEVTVKLPKVAGMIFNQIPTGTVAPAVCKVIDADGNALVAKSVARTDAGYSVVTVSDVKMDLPDAAVAKLDFAAGSIKYLSDLDPVAVAESGSNPEHYQKDRNLDRTPIRMRGATADAKAEQFAKGLTLHAKTELTYDLKGQYKVFKAVAGTDASVVTPSVVKLTIDDGTQILFKGTVKSGDKLVDLNLNVQNVDRLKITVESDGAALDLGNQVSLGNARVLK